MSSNLQRKANLKEHQVKKKKRTSKLLKQRKQLYIKNLKKPKYEWI